VHDNRRVFNWAPTQITSLRLTAHFWGASYDANSRLTSILIPGIFGSQATLDEYDLVEQTHRKMRRTFWASAKICFLFRKGVHYWFRTRAHSALLDALFAVRAMREMRRFREDIGLEHLCILNHSASCFLSTWSVNQCFEFAVQPDLLGHLCSFEHSAGYVFSSWSTTSAFNYRN